MMKHWVRAVLESAAGPFESLPTRTRNDLERISRLIEDRDVATFRTEFRDGIADEFVECTDLDGLTQLMREVAVECGFNYATIFLIRQGDGGVFRTRISTSYPMNWVERYQEMSYQFVDPVVKASAISDRPFLFADLVDDAPLVRSFWEDAARYGISRDGFCVAFDFEGGTRIGVSYSCASEKADFWDIFRFDAHDAVQFARFGAEVFLLLARKSFGVPDTLSQQELRFLHQMVTADDPETIHREASVADEKLDASIRHKLGVRSIVQAVALASANRWFDDLAYDVRDVARAVPDR